MQPVSRRVEQAKAFLRFFKRVYKSEEIAERLVSNVRQRWKLRGALKNIKRKQQAHHIIPIEAFLQSRLVQKAVMGGFELNGVENGIAYSLKRHKSLHADWGSYNRLVMQELFILEDKFPDCGNKAAATKVRALIELLKQEL